MSNSSVGSRLQFTATTLDGLRQQLNAAFTALLSGAVPIAGIRFELRTTVPNKAPESAGSPNLIMVTSAGVNTLYWWNGSSWVALT